MEIAIIPYVCGNFWDMLSSVLELMPSSTIWIYSWNALILWDGLTYKVYKYDGTFNQNHCRRTTKEWTLMINMYNRLELKLFR